MKITAEKISFCIESEWQSAKKATSVAQQREQWFKVSATLNGSAYLAISLHLNTYEVMDSYSLLMRIALNHAYSNDLLSSVANQTETAQ